MRIDIRLPRIARPIAGASEFAKSLCLLHTRSSLRTLAPLAPSPASLQEETQGAVISVARRDR